MQRTFLRNRVTSMAALLAAMLMLAAIATGCAPAQKKAETPRGGAETPIVESQLVRGALPGVQVVAVSKLQKSDQQAIATWIAAGKPADKPATLATGTYKPDIDGHVTQASREVGSDNGIATSMVVLTFDPDGTKLLTDLTTAQVGNDLAVVVGGRVVTIANVSEPVSAGQFVIDGSREMIDSVAKSIVATL